MQYKYSSWHEKGSQGTLEIAESASIGPDCYFDYTGGIIIHPDCQISRQTIIHTHTHQFMTMDWRNRPSSIGLLEIGHHAFIGDRVIILLPCNRIGEHAVIGAGSVVTRDIPAYEICAGNPARKIGDVKHE